MIIENRLGLVGVALAGLALVLSAGACAPAVSSGTPATPTPTPVVPAWAAVPFRGVAGFDTRAYPGDTVMRRWKTESPYRWVGYYLPAPCHTDSTWLGRRPALEAMGWGTALIFTGEQDWASAAPVAGPSAGAAAPAPRCTRSNLTAERGAADAVLADSLAAREGFAAGSSIYLDVERVETVSPELSAYVRGWVGTLLDRGHYLPALYAHARNADTLRAIFRAEYAGRGRPDAGRFWLAGGSASFDVHAAPAESGVAGAHVWQGATDVRETYGGTTLRIDVDVAETASPSSPST